MPVVFNEDVHINGHLTFGSAGGVTLPAASVADAQVVAGAAIGASKTQTRLRQSYAQPSGDTAAAEAKVIHVAKASGQVAGFVAGLVDKCLSGATVDFDLKKNGTTVLTGTVQLTDAHDDYEIVAGTIDTLSYVADDVFEVVVTVAAGGGTLGKGAFAEAIFDENAA